MIVMFFLERAAQDYHMIWTACGTENDTCLAYDYCAVVWSFKSAGLWLKEMTVVCVFITTGFVRHRVQSMNPVLFV